MSDKDDIGDRNWPVNHPKLSGIVEQLLKEHSYDDCLKLAEDFVTIGNRLVHRVTWLREYWAKEDY